MTAPGGHQAGAGSAPPSVPAVPPRTTMTGMEPLQVGVNGYLAVVTDRYGRRGWSFVAPDGTRGPFHLQIGRPGLLRAFAAARNDWRAWVNAHPGEPQQAGANHARSTTETRPPPATNRLGGNTHPR